MNQTTLLLTEILVNPDNVFGRLKNVPKNSIKKCMANLEEIGRDDLVAICNAELHRRSLRRHKEIMIGDTRRYKACKQGGNIKITLPVYLLGVDVDDYVIVDFKDGVITVKKDA